MKCTHKLHRMKMKTAISCNILRHTILLRYVDHRNLHSFPTRRSSDLGGARLRSRLVTRSLRRSQPAGAGGDRKSTRLNSSHGYISYAVFCLKKKRKSPQNVHRKETKTPIS